MASIHQLSPCLHWQKLVLGRRLHKVIIIPEEVIFGNAQFSGQTAVQSSCRHVYLPERSSLGVLPYKIKVQEMRKTLWRVELIKYLTTDKKRVMGKNSSDKSKMILGRERCFFTKPARDISWWIWFTNFLLPFFFRMHACMWKIPGWKNQITWKSSEQGSNCWIIL